MVLPILPGADVPGSTPQTASFEHTNSAQSRYPEWKEATEKKFSELFEQKPSLEKDGLDNKKLQESKDNEDVLLENLFAILNMYYNKYENSENKNPNGDKDFVSDFTTKAFLGKERDPLQGLSSAQQSELSSLVEQYANTKESWPLSKFPELGFEAHPNDLERTDLLANAQARFDKVIEQESPDLNFAENLFTQAEFKPDLVHEPFYDTGFSLSNAQLDFQKSLAKLQNLPISAQMDILKKVLLESGPEKMLTPEPGLIQSRLFAPSSPGLTRGSSGIFLDSRLRGNDVEYFESNNGKISEQKIQDFLTSPDKFIRQSSADFSHFGPENENLSQEDRKKDEHIESTLVIGKNGESFSNSQVTTATNAPASPNPIQGTVNKILDLSDQLKSTQGGTAKIHIQDANLGKINLQVDMTNKNSIHVLIQTENPEVKKSIEDKIEDLKQSLDQQKITLSDFKVTLIDKSFHAQSSFGQSSHQDQNSQNFLANNPLHNNFKQSAQGQNQPPFLAEEGSFPGGTNKDYKNVQKNSLTNIQRGANGSIKVFA